MELWLPLLLTALASLLVGLGICRAASKLGLISIPNNRSSHQKPTPHGGGIGIVSAVTIAVFCLQSEQPIRLIMFIIALPLALTGLLDDISRLSPRIRLGVQLAVCAGFLFLLENPAPITVNQFHIHGLFLVLILLLLGVWWINLFNFMDGIDGIAGAQAVIMLSVGAALIAWKHPLAMASPIWMLMLLIVAATVGFLILNWPPAKIFMGDVGSTWLAFMIFVLALTTVKAGWINYSCWAVLSAVFVADSTVTLLTRIALKECWYEAHSSHAYQRLSRLWKGENRKGHRSVTLLATTINLVWLTPLAAACVHFPNWCAVWILLAYIPLVAGAYLTGAGRP